MTPLIWTDLHEDTAWPWICSERRAHWTSAKLCQVVPSCAKLCQVVPSCAKLCQVVPSCAKLCQVVPSCAKLCQVVPSCAKLCQVVPSCAKLCQVVPSCAKLCQVVPSCAKLCQVVPSCAKLCQVVPRCWWWRSRSPWFCSTKSWNSSGANTRDTMTSLGWSPEILQHDGNWRHQEHSKNTYDVER